VCAEWDYGGVPVWLGQEPGAQFRCSNPVWTSWMQDLFGRVLDETQHLFASNGGPVVLTQVENELHGADAGYVDWCGSMAHSELKARGLSVPVGMCNGESAADTINTCNGKSCTGFAESYGQSGDIFKTKPGIWTEQEGGFQIWGDGPEHPTSYFWGNAPAAQAFDVAQWFARGGSWMSFYMLHGGAHFAGWAGAGITHYYSIDSPVCPDGLPHEPKYSHFASLFAALQRVAPAVAYSPVQVHRQISLPWYDPSKGGFVPGTQQVAFVYDSAQGRAAGVGPVAFVESSADTDVLTRWSGINVTMAPSSSALLDAASGTVLWQSSDVKPPSVVRSTKAFAGPALAWEHWAEPQGAEARALALPSNRSGEPLEAGSVLLGLDQYLYYSVNATLTGAATLQWQGSKATAWVVLVDGKPVPGGFVDDHGHSDGTKTYSVDLAAPAGGGSAEAEITLLFASLGYSNNMGYKSGAKLKGILGKVTVGGKDVTGNGWDQRTRLAGSRLGVAQPGSTAVAWTPGPTTAPLSWMRATFTGPTGLPAGAAVSLNATGLARGHFFVNGRDAGRYWNIARNDGRGRTQTLFHIPADWLNAGQENTIAVIDTLGAPSPADVTLTVSTLVPGTPAAPADGWANSIHSCDM